jgi:hypothetical protein
MLLVSGYHFIYRIKPILHIIWEYESIFMLIVQSFVVHNNNLKMDML